MKRGREICLPTSINTRIVLSLCHITFRDFARSTCEVPTSLHVLLQYLHFKMPLKGAAVGVAKLLEVRFSGTP